MKIVRFIIPLLITSSLIYFLSNAISLGGTSAPPLGHFLNPFEGFWQNATNKNLSINSEITLKGLQNSVSIQYDSNLVPHITASNDKDLYMAQGYVIANLRLWQMEFQTHAAAGRISELIGDKGINFDRLQRRKGMVHGAKATLASFENDPYLVSLVDAYADGVNTYISSLSYRDLPLEYKLMDYEPEPWTPLKTALILQYMTDNLTGFDNDLENTNARNLFGGETFDLLFPDRPEGIEPTITTHPDSLWAFDPIVTTEINTEDIKKYTGKTFEKPDPSNGSNNWVVSGSKTKSGVPILSNDTHLGLNLPSLWIMMQLQSPTVNVYGYTFAGALGITIGHNDSTSWGFTNAPRDTRDWYNITFKDDTELEYLYDSAWRSTTLKIEEIKAKGSEPFYDTVIYTHHGPVVYDGSFLNDDHKNQYYALKWSGHNPSRVQNGLLLLNRANNYDEHIAAIEYWDSPPQNIVFSSTQGDIAMTVQGDFPVKWKGQGKFLMDGSNPSHEWGITIPKAQNARILNPEKGFIGSANQHSVDSLYPYYFYNASNEYYRNRRINDLLSSKQNITIQDMAQMQMDSYSLKAAEILPLLLDSLRGDKFTVEQIDYLERLKRWDYVYRAETKAPLIFNIWWMNLYSNIWDEFDVDTLAMARPSHYNTYLLMKDNPSLAFFDNASTANNETLTELINQSFDQTSEYLKKLISDDPEYNWGDDKATKILHLSRIKDLSILNIQIDGHRHAINSTKGQHGPSQRFVVEMTSPPTAYGIYPGGQSGNPGSYYYDNMVEKWRTGELLPLLFMQPNKNYDDQIMISQTLTPSEK
jgi:penicillin amidase